jgi:hypothetical protein
MRLKIAPNRSEAPQRLILKHRTRPALKSDTGVR